MSQSFGRNTSWVDGLIAEVRKLDERQIQAIGERYDANRTLEARRAAADVVRANGMDRESGWARGFAKDHVDRRLDGAIEDAALAVVVADKIDQATYDTLVSSLREAGVAVPDHRELHPH